MLTAGQTFARYVIEAPIGEGGMGEVYRAFDDKLRRKVALKVLHPDLAVPDAAARLVREARAAAAFAHPNTIAIYDLGEIDGTVFLVMELISGAPLRAFIGDASVPIQRKLRWLVDIARGLGAAHKAGLVHRDVKPANVMVSDDGVVKVLDFGLAKPLEASSFHTDVGLVVGTPRYMAPELFTGVRADARSDQYAFGVTAYELLSGAYPGGPTSAAVPAALDTLVPEIGPAVARIVARTLSRDAADRFASMNEVAAALEEEIVHTRVSEARSGAAKEPAPSTRREGATAGAVDALALAPTELPSSTAVSRAATRVAPLPPPPVRSRALPMLALLAVVAAGAYGAVRVLGVPLPAFLAGDAPHTTDAGDAATTALADGAADPSDAALDGSDLATLPLAAPGDDAASGDAAIDDAQTDADADAAADALAPPRTVPLDEFADPWAHPPAH